MKIRNYKILFFLLLTANFFFARNASAGTIIHPPSYLGLQNGLVGCWGFDGASSYAQDCSVYANKGTLTGGPIQTSGQLGQALTFDGTDDRVLIPANTVFNNMSALSVVTWTKITSTAADRTMINKKTGSPGWTFFINSGGRFRFGVGYSTSSIDVFSFTGQFPLNTWQMNVVTWDGVNAAGVKFYRNGANNAIESAAGGGGSRLDDSGGTVNIGASSFLGDMDDVRIFNRVLSAQEIVRMYRIGLASKNNRAQGADQFDKGLVGHWTLDANDIGLSGTRAKDRSGFNNHGTLTLGPLQDPGQVGQALYFDGIDDYVTVADSATLDQATNFSFGAWTNLQSVAATAYAVLSKWNAAGSRNYYLGKSTSSCSGTMCCTIDNVTAHADITLALVENKGWHHLFCVADASAGKLYAYLDGNLISSDTYDGSSETGTSTLNIGNSANGIGTAQAKGDIDDARVYSRALSAAAVKRLYDITQPKINVTQNTLDKGLVGHWTFDGNDIGLSGTKALDRSGNTNHGTIANGPIQVAGKIGQGLSFEGINDQVDAGSPAVLDDLPAFTYSLWVKPSVVGANQLIMDKKNGANGKIFFTYLSNALRFIMSCTTSGSDTISNETIPINDWSHVVYTWDGSANATGIHMYKNGAEVTYLGRTACVGGPLTEAARSLRLGNDGAGALFAGSLDDVRVYSRALSAGEVNKLYQMGR